MPKNYKWDGWMGLEISEGTSAMDHLDHYRAFDHWTLCIYWKVWPSTFNFPNCIFLWTEPNYLREWDRPNIFWSPSFPGRYLVLLTKEGFLEYLDWSCEVYIPIPTSSEWAELDPLKVMGAICAIGDSIPPCHANLKTAKYINKVNKVSSQKRKNIFWTYELMKLYFQGVLTPPTIDAFEINLIKFYWHMFCPYSCRQWRTLWNTYEGIASIDMTITQ